MTKHGVGGILGLTVPLGGPFVARDPDANVFVANRGAFTHRLTNKGILAGEKGILILVGVVMIVDRADATNLDHALHHVRNLIERDVGLAIPPRRGQDIANLQAV